MASAGENFDSPLLKIYQPGAADGAGGSSAGGRHQAGEPGPAHYNQEGGCTSSMAFLSRYFRSLRLLCGVAALAAFALVCHAQFGSVPATQVLDASCLKPPPGARVAIVEFADMECPTCGHDNPIIKAAAEKYHIPWIRHDFPIRYHAWSFQAAVYARWFDTHSKKIGDDYRDAVFANQPNIYNLGVLRDFTRKFAQSHGLTLPFDVDPQGKLADAVRADYALGVRTGVHHTPTVWIVTSQSKGSPYMEVSTDMSDLDSTIQRALNETK